MAHNKIQLIKGPLPEGLRTEMKYGIYLEEKIRKEFNNMVFSYGINESNSALRDAWIFSKLPAKTSRFDWYNEEIINEMVYDALIKKTVEYNSNSESKIKLIADLCIKETRTIKVVRDDLNPQVIPVIILNATAIGYMSRYDKG